MFTGAGHCIYCKAFIRRVFETYGAQKDFCVGYDEVAKCYELN